MVDKTSIEFLMLCIRNWIEEKINDPPSEVEDIIEELPEILKLVKEVEQKAKTKLATTTNN